MKSILAILTFFILWAQSQWASACDYQVCQGQLSNEIGGYNGIGAAKNGIKSEVEYYRSKNIIQFGASCDCYLNKDHMIRKYLEDSLPDVRANIAKWEADQPERDKKDAEQKRLKAEAEAKQRRQVELSAVADNRANKQKQLETAKRRATCNFQACKTTYNNHLGGNEGVIFAWGISNEKLYQEAKARVDFYDSCDCFIKELAPFMRDDIQKMVPELRQGMSDWDKQKMQMVEQEQKNNQLIKEQKAKDARDATAECKAARFKKIFCARLHSAETAQIRIDHEKEVGKTSGYVNARVLNENASFILSMKNNAAKARTDYKQITGKDIANGYCKITRVPGDMVPMAQIGEADVENDVKKFCGSVE